MFDKKVPWFHGKTVSFSSFFAFQPQNSMPDVVVWLISGTKRIASFRIPAYDVLYSPNVESCGQYCSKVFNMFMKVTIQFVVRLLVYFQRGIDSDSWIFFFLIILLLWQNARICGKKEFIQDWQTILSCCWNVFTNKKRRFSIFESPIIHSVWPRLPNLFLLFPNALGKTAYSLEHLKTSTCAKRWEQM